MGHNQTAWEHKITALAGGPGLALCSGAMKTALLLIDVQNDYFPGWAFPLWNTAATLAVLRATAMQARASGDLVVHVRHLAAAGAGIAPFFNAGTQGSDIHPDMLAAAPDAPVVVKHYADAFQQTGLEALLSAHGITHLRLAGMMTQNCVTHTALSRAAEKYTVSVLADGCTTVSHMLHLIALNALAQRVNLEKSPAGGGS